MTPQETRMMKMKQMCGTWKSKGVKLKGVPNTKNPYWYQREDNEGDDIDYE